MGGGPPLPGARPRARRCRPARPRRRAGRCRRSWGRSTSQSRAAVAARSQGPALTAKRIFRPRGQADRTTVARVRSLRELVSKRPQGAHGDPAQTARPERPHSTARHTAPPPRESPRHGTGRARPAPRGGPTGPQEAQGPTRPRSRHLVTGPEPRDTLGKRPKPEGELPPEWQSGGRGGRGARPTSGHDSTAARGTTPGLR